LSRAMASPFSIFPSRGEAEDGGGECDVRDTDLLVNHRPPTREAGGIEGGFDLATAAITSTADCKSNDRSEGILAPASL